MQGFGLSDTNITGDTLPWSERSLCAATDATTYRCFADHDAGHFNAFDRRLVVGVVDHARNFVLEYE